MKNLSLKKRIAIVLTVAILLFAAADIWVWKHPDWWMPNLYYHAKPHFQVNGITYWSGAGSVEELPDGFSVEAVVDNTNVPWFAKNKSPVLGLTYYLNPDDSSKIYVSSKVNPESSAALKYYEYSANSN